MDAKTLMTFLQARGVEFKLDDDGGLVIEGYLDLATDYMEEIKTQKEAIIALLTGVPATEDQFVDPIVDADPVAKRDENFWQDGWYELFTSAQQVLGYRWDEVPYERRPLIFPERDGYVREMNIAHAARDRDAWRAAFDQWVACQNDAVERILAGEQVKQWDQYAEARSLYAGVVEEVANAYTAMPSQDRPSPGNPAVLAVERRINRAMAKHDLAAVQHEIQQLRRVWKDLGLLLTNVEPRTPS